MFVCYSKDMAFGFLLDKDAGSLIDGDSFVQKESPCVYYEAYKDKILIGYVFDTKYLIPDKSGYGGEIEMLLAVDSGCKIKNIKILSHNETPQYASKIIERGFLDQFNEKSYLDKFIVGDDIDGITQATISSQSVSDIIRQSLEKIQEIIKKDVEAKEIPISNVETDLRKLGLDPKEAKYYKVLDE
ncbi:MAG: FMN-binding protein [Candidatus Omnitrophota bacterium]